MPVDVAELRRQLLQLSQQQLTEIADYIRGLQRSSGPEATSWVVIAFTNECEALGLGHVSARARTDATRHAVALEAFVDRACNQIGRPPSLEMRQMVVRAGVKLLHQEISSDRLTATPVLLAANLGRVPAVVDRAFPGYAAMGILGRIIALERSETALKPFSRPSR